MTSPRIETYDGDVLSSHVTRPLAGVIIGIALACGAGSDEGANPPAPPPDLPQLQVEAIPEAARADIEEALLEAQRNPTEAPATGRLGMILHAYKQYESAALCYDRAQAIAPDEFRWAYLLGTVRFLLGQDESAVEPLRQALDLSPNYLPARIKLAQVLSTLADYSASEKEYRAALAQDPESALAHYGLGRLVAARDGTAAAIDHYRKACDLSPTFGAAHYALAQAYRADGDNEKADAHLAVFEQNKNADEPLEDPLLHEVASRARNPANNHYEQGLAFADAGNIEAAVKEFEKALEADPSLIQARVNLVSLYGGLGRPEDVARHYAAAAKSHPDRADLHYNYGVFHAEQSRYAEAEKAFREAVRADRLFAEAHSNLGQMLEAQRRIEDAEKHYRLALGNKPTFRMAHFHLGRVLLMQGKNDEGIKHFLKTLSPEDEETPKYMLDVAVAYARIGDPANARRYAQQAHERAGKLGQPELVSMSDKMIEKLGGSLR